MPRDSKDAIRSKRFTNPIKAQNFADKVKGKVIDLRGNQNRKSDYKVSYTKGNVNNRTDKFTC